MSSPSSVSSSLDGLDPSRRGLFVTVAALAAGWTVVVALSLYAALPDNALGRPRAIAWVRVVLPQGWGFFTRDPREPDVAVYRAHDGEWESAVAWPNAIPENLLGLSRDGRGQGIEIGNLAGRLEWSGVPRCRGALEACIDRDTAVDVVNDSPHPTLCGELVIQRRAPVPWAWVRSLDASAAPYQVRTVNARC